MRLILILALSLVTQLCLAQDWTFTQSPVNEHFNGIDSSPDGRLRIAVGNAGKIVHFNRASPSGTVMASGTTKDLFDVYVGGAGFAVASGRDNVLLWNGTNWSPIITDDGLYLPVWATPDQSTIMYNIVDESGSSFPFHIRCSYDIAAGERSPFCQAGSLDINFCADGGDITVVQASGDIEAIQKDLSPTTGSVGMVFDQVNTLSLTSVFIPPTACNGGGLPPQEITAINNFKDVYHFGPDINGVSEWTRVHTGTNDKTIVWVDGTGINDWVAGGYQPSADVNDPTNDSYALSYDGNAFTELTGFADGMRGITDLSYHFNYTDRIFADGGEDEPGYCTDAANPACTPAPAECVGSEPGDCFMLSASLELGGLAIYKPPVPPPVADVYILGSSAGWVLPNPDGVDTVNYLFLIGNNGPETATKVSVSVAQTFGETVTVTNCADFIDITLTYGTVFHLKGDLPKGDLHTCEFSITSRPVPGKNERTGVKSMNTFNHKPDRNPANNKTVCSMQTGICNP